MENKIKNKKKSAAATAVAVITKNEFGLTVAQMESATKLQALCPAIVEMVGLVSQFESGLMQKYFGLCKSIRDQKLPGDGSSTRGMSRPEVTLLLQSLGYTKQRITEINRVVEVPPEIWAKFESKEMGFRATLALARAKPGEQTEADPDVVPPQAPKKEFKLTLAQQDVLVDASVRLGSLKIKTTKGDEGFQFIYEGTAYRFTFNLFVDSLGAKNV